jgi:hypothetical protein
MQTIPLTRRSSVSVTDLELLHAGLGALIAHYSISDKHCMARCIALGLSRQLRLIAEHPALPDPGLRPLYLTMAARWHVYAVDEAHASERFIKSISSEEDNDASAT